MAKILSEQTNNDHIIYKRICVTYLHYDQFAEQKKYINNLAYNDLTFIDCTETLLIYYNFVAETFGDFRSFGKI
jgi:hypothetical protein